MRTGNALRSLLRYTFENYSELSNGTELMRLFRRDGSLYVYRTDEEFDADQYAWQLRAAHGVDFELLDQDAVASMAPALEKIFRRGVYLRDHGHCRNPEGLVEGLVDVAVSLGARVIVDDVRKLAVRNGRLEHIICRNGEYKADKVVIAAGVESSALVRSLGVRVPLVRERGYHVTFESADIPLPVPVMSAADKFFLTPMEMGIRAAGTSEFTRHAARPNRRRIKSLQDQAISLVPGLRGVKVSDWMGERPALPDSLPIIDSVPGAPSVFLAFGHGHLGLSGASTTAYMVSDMIERKVPRIDPGPFSVSRFRNHV